MRIYIAGPMRGIAEFNFPAFDAARDAAKRLGWDVVSPADLDRAIGFDGIGKRGTDDEWTPVIGRKQTIQRDIDALYECDAIALLPGWQKSSGAAVELALAKFLGYKVLDAITFEELK